MQNLPTPSSRFTAGLAVAAGWLAFAPLAAAQTSDGSPPSDADTVVKLSPFDVAANQDHGYQSTASASITRLSTPIFDLPMSIQVINPQLMSDLAINNLFDIGQLIVGGVNEGATAVTTLTGFKLRGITQLAPDSTERDTFRVAGPFDLFDVDRVEVIRGPNSVVQGASEPGGQINVVTKSAQYNSNFEDLSFQAGDNELARATLDLNRSFKIDDHNVAIRVNAVTDRHDSYIKFNWNEVHGADVALQADLTAKTVLTFKFQYLEELSNPISAIPDRWSGSPGLHGGYDIALAREVPQLYNYDEANATGGPDGTARWDSTYYLTELTQNFTEDLHFRVQAEYADEPLNQVQLSGANPTLAYNATSNSYYLKQTAQWTYADNARYNLRALLNYDLHLGPTTQKLVAGYSLLTVRLRQVTDLLWSNATNTEYTWNTPVAPGAITAANYSIPLAGNRWQAQTPTGDNVVNPSYFINSTGSYFNDRLTTVLGFSWNWSRREDFIYTAPTSGSYKEGTATVPASIGATPADTNAKIPMVSAMYAITSTLHVFADYSKSYVPQTAYEPTLNVTNGQIGPSLAPDTGRGGEVGLKYEADQGKLGATVSLYSFIQDNISQVINTAIVDEFYPNSTQRYYTPGGAAKSKGVDFELFYNPTAELSFTANYAYNEAYIVEDPAAPQYLGYATNTESKHIANAQVRYTFDSTPLKGFFLGGSVHGRSRTFNYQLPEYSFSPGFAVFGLFAGYTGKAWGERYTLQANVENVGDREYFISEAMLGSPTTFSVTARIHF
jgi:iron complex outermembrane receptor protein